MLGWLVCVVCCQVMECEVWMVQCVSVHSQKKAAQHTALFACDGVHQCVVLYGVWWVSVSVCCGVVWWVQEKGKRQTHSQTKTKRTFPKTTFFPFFHLFFIHSFLLAFHSSTITPFLSVHSPVFHASHEYLHGEPKTPMTQHPIHFIVFSSCPNSLFLFLSSCG